MRLLKWFHRMSLPKLALLALVLLLTFMSTNLNIAWSAPADNPSPSIYDYYSNNGVLFYSANTKGCSSSSSSSSDTTSATSGTGTPAPAAGTNFNLDQVKAFASSPLASTFGVSDQAAESYFLKGNATIAGHFGLDSSSIGAVTAAIKAAGVSPALFYAYAVNEGGGAGGFINHYGSDAPGGAAANAQRDAEYLVDQAKTTTGEPATGGGEPGDMPTAEATSFLHALPAGSIGIVYLQATSAVTAEVESLSGKTGAWTIAFGHPLSQTMEAITTMGGNPLSAGAATTATSCATAAVAGKGMQAAISWATNIANNNGYGYDQSARTTGYPKWKSDPNCTNACASFDCSSFISAMLTVAGYFQDDPAFTTSNESAALQGVGFKDVTNQVNLANGQGLQAGDILLNTSSHTEMYLGDNKNVGAHEDENHGISGGQVGDQSGNEISVTPYYSDSWDHVWRAPN